MAITKVTRDLLNTSIVDNGNATAITIDSSENVTFSADIITASAGTSNTRVGVNAGNSIESGGNYNVVVGEEAGTDLTTGDKNTLLGFAAGANTTTADNNTFIGSESGFTNVTGTSNIGVGWRTLLLSTASNNTAVGYAALTANTTGTGNTAMGATTLDVVDVSTATAVATFKAAVAVAGDAIITGTGTFESTLVAPEVFVETTGHAKILGELTYLNTLTLRTSIIGHELQTKYSLLNWFLSQKKSVKGSSPSAPGFPNPISSSSRKLKELHICS